jgi:hypothetical protein
MRNRTLTPSIVNDLLDRKSAGISAYSAIDDAAAELLAKDKRAEQFELCLSGLQSLTATSARWLASWGRPANRLHLDGLKGLPKEVARELAQVRAYYLDLSGLVEVTSEAAKELAARHPDLCREYDNEGYYLGWPTLILKGLQLLSPAAAAALAAYPGMLDLGGLRELPAPVATALAGHAGQLRLDGVTSLSAQSATELAKRREKVELGGIKSLEKEAIAALAGGHPNLLIELKKLEVLSDESAEVIAHSKVTFIFSVDIKIYPSAALRLARCENWGHYIGIRAVALAKRKAGDGKSASRSTPRVRRK